MDRTLPVILFLLFSIPTRAQIPNSGFENWSAPFGWDDPDGWLTLNGLTEPYGQFTATQGPGYIGSSCLELTTLAVSGFTTVAGYAISGDSSLGIPGFAFDQRPAELNGYWKYDLMPGGSDHGLVVVVLTKWNALTHSSDPIGGGEAINIGNAFWNPFSVIINYVSTDDPDTAAIHFTSSGTGTLGVNNRLSVDQLEFDATTGIDDPAFSPHGWMIDDVLHLEAADIGGHIRIMDALGRELRTAVASTDPFSLDLSDLPHGLVLVETIAGTGQRKVLRFMRRTKPLMPVSSIGNADETSHTYAVISVQPWGRRLKPSIATCPRRACAASPPSPPF